MATEFHTMNYITNHLERLPLVDSYGPERFSNLFCYQSFNEGQEKNSRFFTTSSTSIEGNNRSFCEYNFINENNTRRQDSSSENKNKVKQNHDELESKIKSLISVESCSEEQGKCSDNRRCVSQTTNKRKRTTDPTGSESSKFTSCDEEIKKLGLKESTGQFRKEINTLSESTRNISSPCFKRKSLHKLPPEQKRFKNRPALNFDIMQRRSSSSTSWLPFKIRGSERKVKIIKVTPIDSTNAPFVGVCDAKLQEDAYFRPITVDER